MTLHLLIRLQRHP